MRFLRVPYYYLDNSLLLSIYNRSKKILEAIYCIHNDEPARDWYFPDVKFYLYYPIFLKWCGDKALIELTRRGRKLSMLDEKYSTLKSRDLIDFFPPTDEELAEDVAWLLEWWSDYECDFKDAKKLPMSYVHLMMKYGHSLPLYAEDRLDLSSQDHTWLDAEWFQSTNKEKKVGHFDPRT